MDKPSFDVRLETLERENRLWRWGGGLSLIAGLVAVIGGAQRANDLKVVEAERLIIRDQDGKERIRLGLAPNGDPAIFLQGKDGKSRVILQASDEDDCGSLNLFGSGEQPGLSVVLDGGLRSSNSPSLTLRRDDKRRINLNVDTTSERPWLRLQDESGVLFQAPEPSARRLGRP